MGIMKIDGSILKEMFLSGAALLANNREGVDALNVFPVPDGDTGTNMSHTIQSAVKELSNKNFASVGDVADCVAKGALKGARGNSGVILSQILRGFARALSGHEEMDAQLLVSALVGGAETAYKAVMKPKEGTILTVQRVIAEELQQKLDSSRDLQELFQQIMVSGDAILKKTPDMLPVLKQAGVVDSGGKGLMVIYAGMYAALTGEPVEVEMGDAASAQQQKLPGEFEDDHSSLEEITFAYCTEFIVSHPRPDMKDSEVSRLRRRLERIGDCVLVISDMSVVKVHVHTNEPGKALQMALELGELDSIKIENMLEEFRERMAARLAREEEEKAAAAAEEKEYGVVSVALGDGFSAIFQDLGVDKIVDGGQTMNPSIEDLLGAIDATNARNVFVLPNNTNIILAAQQAAELTERNVCVLPTKSVPMGISAVLAFQPDAPFEANEAAMREAAETVHTASITFAVRDTVFDGKDIHSGDIMGLIDNKVEILGNDVADVARQLMEQMVTEDSSLVTVYSGADVRDEDAEALRQELEAHYDACDVELQKGGQPLYYYLIAVE
ncbi:MAG: DAK2 domain-containing protein [Clostridia bacterium]|nr:DAK2 domain-containing protein [Clostridia bacterium]